MPAGLPNITGTFIADVANTKPSGAFYLGNTVTDNTGSTGGSSDIEFKFDASRSNAIYGAADTVQPPSISLIPQIRY